MPDTITAYDLTPVQLLEESAAFGTGGKEEFMRTGRLPLRIISPGWGNSAYYGPDQLREAAQKGLFPAGMKMFWDHPSISEKVERPERSLRDLAATFIEAAHWDPNGPKGPGLYTVAEVFTPYREAVWEMRRHIGPSIRAYGNTYFGEAEGRQGPIVEDMIAAESVDFVTAPGRGGEIIQLFEAARPAADNTPAVSDVWRQKLQEVATHNTQENSVELQEAQAMVQRRETELTEAHQRQVTALEETIRTVTGERDEARSEVRRLTEAAILREARETVAEALKPVSNLPEITKNRLVDVVSFNPPVDAQGALDKVKLASNLEEAVKNEAKYLAEASGSGRPFGFGAGLGGGAPDQTTQTQALEEALRAGWNLSDDEAKSAAGRH